MAASCDLHKEKDIASRDIHFVQFQRDYQLHHALFDKCDVIKQNESELAIIDFEIQPIIAFSLYFNVLSITKMTISLEPNAQLLISTGKALKRHHQNEIWRRVVTFTKRKTSLGEIHFVQFQRDHQLHHHELFDK